jgi:hypothetical protein
VGPQIVCLEFAADINGVHPERHHWFTRLLMLVPATRLAVHVLGVLPF